MGLRERPEAGEERKAPTCPWPMLLLGERHVVACAFTEASDQDRPVLLEIFPVGSRHPGVELLPRLLATGCAEQSAIRRKILAVSGQRFTLSRGESSIEWRLNNRQGMLPSSFRSAADCRHRFFWSAGSMTRTLWPSARLTLGMGFCFEQRLTECYLKRSNEGLFLHRIAFRPASIIEARCLYEGKRQRTSRMSQFTTALWMSAVRPRVQRSSRDARWPILALARRSRRRLASAVSLHPKALT